MINTAIRAIIRSAGHFGFETFGFQFCYRGVIEGDFMPFTFSKASGITQRGGSPTSYDKILAGTLGYEAVKAFYDELTGIMVGVIKNTVKITPLEETFEKIKK